MEIKDRLLKIREATGCNQTQFAKKIGISARMISLYENGKNRPSYENLVKYADFSGKTVDWILGRLPEDKEKTVPDVSETVEAITDEGHEGFTKEQIDFIQALIDEKVHKKD